MDTAKLSRWADLLLDTGKRNNLINFKDLKMGTAEVVFPDFTTFFSYIEHTPKFEVYDPKLEDEEEYRDILDDYGEGQPEEKRISKREYLYTYERKLKRQQVLLYNASNKPIQVLKNIAKKARIAIEETGVNIAYLAFGFIHWTESEDSQIIMQAPILLVPVSIENESSVEPYYIKVTDDEVVVNPTFAFKLQNDYGIKFPDFDGYASIEEYLQKIESIVSKLKWKVSRECKIGIFSFLKINMYKDIKDNAAKISQNDGIRALLGVVGMQPNMGSGEGEPSRDLLDLHNVVDADSSQAEAIEFAKKGKSFVLQGPPGTGKSQTITNIIAECLFDGKKVLFVSEKLAALSVVYDKLKQVGLEEFCLELHSHKANKKQVIEELFRTLKLPKSGLSDKAEKELRIKKELQKQLDDYATELHKIRPVINKTLYQLYEEASACRTAPDVDFVIGDIKNKGEEYIEKAEIVLLRYTEYTPSIGYDFHNNIWYGYNNLDYSYHTVMQLKNDLQMMISLCGELSNICETLKNKYSLNANSLQYVFAFRKFFLLAKKSGFITPSLLIAQTATKVLESAQKLQELANEILSRKSLLDATFDSDIYKLDGQRYHKKLTKQNRGFFTRLFSGEYRRMIKEINLCKKDGKRLKYQTAVEAVNNLRIYQEKSQEFDEIQKPIHGCFGLAYQGVYTDFDLLVSELCELTDIHSSGVSFENIVKMTVESFEAEKSCFAQISSQFESIFEKYNASVKRLTESFNADEYNVQGVELNALVEKCQGCIDNVDKLDNWCEFSRFLGRLKKLDLMAFIDHAIERKIETSQIVLAFKRAFYMRWIDAVLHDSPMLISLARVPHDEVVKRFKEKDKLNFEINKTKIKARLSAQRPNLDMVAQGSSIAILLREGEKKRKQKSIRLLLSEIGELAQTLKPCFLMSPLSVSTFLSPDMKFDVVVFDEASQIFPQDAIGAIYRGKQLIVVGDSKQMPPSNFFNSVADSDDENEDDIMDFESILDLCSTTFPQCRLKWHYRSRFEQLISFSNKNFYENELITFPSSKTDRAGIGVDFFYVDGTFDRNSKTNLVEAERIVDLVFENIEKHPERSLGVVAFSMAQQNLIDKLISKRRQQDSSKEPFFRLDKAEPFFVKNLETVQGDERDTIIFSIAYAKDAQGRLLLNFGPINHEGGERRLNVAVTRAKFNVQLVSSMHCSDIDLSRTNSVGTRLLREYLDYAENGAVALERTISVNPYEQFDSEFELEVCEFLREKGFSVDTQVGCSSFKIDLALKHPHSSDYVLAIECDGATYHSSRTARDRDRLRQDILERMGWRFYRIWSTDWFRNTSIEKERLLKAAKEAIENAPREVQKRAEEVSFTEAVAVKHFKFPQYTMADERALSRKFRGDISSVTHALLEVESPLSEEWLLKRIVFLFDGRKKVTGVVRDSFNRLMRNCGSQGIIRRNGFLYLQGKDIPMLRVPANGVTPREIKYIDVQELALGLKEILRQNITAEKMGLFKLMVQQLGFSRMGDAILARMERALKLISKDIETNGEIISLKDS